ncbi:MAG: transposase [Alphaproteobacteria bacterium]|nr:transposase [Alphaproteobacteria bacterium]
MRDRRALASSGQRIKRRRRFSVEEKQAILRAAAGSTVSDASRQYGVGRSLIHNWRRQEAVSVLGATVRFTPVAVEPEGRRSGTIEIEPGGGVRVRVDDLVDEEALKRVLRALGR